jgi:hypothetical protein
MLNRRKMKRSLLMFVVGCLAICLSSCRHGTDVATESTEKATTEIPNKRRFDVYQVVGVIPGLKKFVVKYNDELIRGGAPYSDEGFEQLKKMGVKTIISITPDENERKLASKHKIGLIEIPFSKDAPVPEDVKRKFLNLFHQYEAPFYLHGNESTSRAGVMGALYRMKICGWPFGKTMMEYLQLGGDMKKDKIMIDSIKK